MKAPISTKYYFKMFTAYKHGKITKEEWENFCAALCEKMRGEISETTNKNKEE